jgi:CubicO group peptidase (beta-lactamase class C family)
MTGAERGTGSPFAWGAADPEQAGFSATGLAALRDGLAARGTEQLFVARGDRIGCEWYAPQWDASRRHDSASLAKALVGGLALLVAVGDGRLRPDDRAARYVAAWRDDPVRSRITIRHLATHTSGLSDASYAALAADPGDPGRGWEAAFWKREPDPFTISRDRAPILFEPGSAYRYSNPGMAMLGYCITAALRGAPQEELRTLLRDRVYGPIGLSEAEWSIGYETPYQVDGLTLWATWGGGAFTARAVARIARLVVQRGDWQGRRLLDPATVAQALRYAGTPKPDRTEHPASPASGLAWYTNEDGVWPDVPPDAFAGAGAGHQLLLAVPCLDLVAVRLGRALEGGQWDEGFWAAAHRYVIAPLMASLNPG